MVCKSQYVSARTFAADWPTALSFQKESPNTSPLPASKYLVLAR